jgi:two-component system KDP operon response regulator KdpE
VRLVWPESPLNVRQTAEQALHFVRQGDCHLVVLILDLDVCSPVDRDRCRCLRERSPGALLVLSTHDTAQERVSAFTLGADQFLPKPFTAMELYLRLSALARHLEKSAVADQQATAQGDQPVPQTALAFRDETHEVCVEGRSVRLTRTEYGLLRDLALHPGETMPHCELLRHVWGAAYDGETHYLKVFVQRIRRKLGDPRWIRTVHGVGYQFLPPPQWEQLGNQN